MLPHLPHRYSVPYTSIGPRYPRYEMLCTRTPTPFGPGHMILIDKRPLHPRRLYPTSSCRQPA